MSRGPAICTATFFLLGLSVAVDARASVVIDMPPPTQASSGASTYQSYRNGGSNRDAPGPLALERYANARARPTVTSGFPVGNVGLWYSYGYPFYQSCGYGWFGWGFSGLPSCGVAPFRSLAAPLFRPSSFRFTPISR